MRALFVSTVSSTFLAEWVQVKFLWYDPMSAKCVVLHKLVRLEEHILHNRGVANFVLKSFRLV